MFLDTIAKAQTKPQSPSQSKFTMFQGTPKNVERQASMVACAQSWHFVDLGRISKLPELHRERPQTHLKNKKTKTKWEVKGESAEWE